jgi:branched-chain amino acid transport system ATP-binding protein
MSADKKAPARDPKTAFFHCEDVSVHYGAIRGVSDISFSVNKGEIVTLIGSNGAGKSTTLRAISGLVKVSKGQVTYKNELISSLPAHEIVKRRLCQVPEGRGIFLNLSVEENLDLGAWTMKNHSSYDADLEHVFHLFPRLKERRKQNSGTLSGGELQMLAIGRALMAHPEFLLLDEPSLGLAPQVIEKIFEIIVAINKEGTTVLLVEQNALKALQIAHYGVVLESGSIKTQGPAKELLASDEVKKAYLGI